MNTFAKVSSIIGGLVLLVALVAVSGMYRFSPLSAAHGVSAAVDVDYIGNSVAASVANTVTVTIVDAGRNDNSVIDTIGGELSAEVVVTNLTSGVSIQIAATETATDTHIFTRTFDVTTSTTEATTSPPQIAAANGEKLQVTYCFVKTTTACDAGSTFADTPGFASSIIVDALGPTFANALPAATSTSNNTTQIHKLDIGDAGVGLGATAAIVRSAVEFTIRGVAQDPGPVTALAAGGTEQWQVERTSAGNPQGNLVWSVTAKDTLGNSATTASYLLVIDSVAPDLTAAHTGDIADTSVTPVVNDTTTDTRTSVRLVFDDDIDGTTVNASDFLAQDGGTTIAINSCTHHADLTTSVFCVLGTTLASDQKPSIQVVGDIRDTANNAAALGDAVVATDGIAPAVSASLTGTATGNVVTNKTLVVRVTADEKSTNPTLSGGQLVVKKVHTDGSTPTSTALTASSFATVDDSKVWEWTFTFLTDQTQDGLYNVEASITDGSQAGTVGKSTADHADSIFFEVDTNVPTPTITYSGDDASTFVNVDFAAEANEFSADYTADEDSHNTITSLTATVGGVAVTANSIDNINYTIAAPAAGYAVGDHQFSLTAVDEAGNTKTFATASEKITIVDRAKFKVTLQPGYNLISLPGAATSAAINDVISATHPINQVMSYDPAVAGGWTIAERDAAGAFAGTLHAIGTEKAYLVRTTTFETLDVLIPRVSAGNQVLPPSIPLTAGWNLVPVIDITGDLTGSAPTVAAYFSDAKIARVYTLDNFGKLIVATGNTSYGKGYWVYVTADTVLVP